MPLYGPMFPLKKGNNDTFEIYKDIKSQISFFLKNLILTSPGENISDPNYGVGLRRFLFEPNLVSYRDEIQTEIEEQISRYLPYLGIEDITITATSQEIDSNYLNVIITYSIPGEDVLQTFELAANSQNTIGFY